MYLILLSILIPILSGIFLLVRKDFSDRKHLTAAAAVGFILTGILVIAAITTAYGTRFVFGSDIDRVSLRGTFFF